MFKRSCFSRNASARSCFLSCTTCCASHNCVSRRPNSFCACRTACRDPDDLVNCCNLERRREDTSSSLATFSLLSLSRVGGQLDRHVPCLFYTPRNRNAHGLLIHGEKRTNVLWSLGIHSYGFIGVKRRQLLTERRIKHCW